MANTNHGLTVYSYRVVDPSQRLQRPAGGDITNCFNDAITVTTYDDVYDDFGHTGIDFGCGANAPVVAMYGGEVINMKVDWSTNPTSSAGNWVKIRSCTNAEDDSGFEHTYLHLNSVDDKVIIGKIVKKGQQIGLSGGTGGVVPHLHVHLAPFDGEGNIAPATVSETSDKKDPVDGSTWAKGDLLVPPVRVQGRMNFLCFLEPDDDAFAPVVSYPSLLESPRKVLSPRASDAIIPVFRTIPADYNSSSPYDTDVNDDNARGRTYRTHKAYVGGDEIACYVVEEEDLVRYAAPLKPIIWYKIRHRDLDSPGQYVTGWVPSHGRVVAFNPDTNTHDTFTHVAWVHVEEAVTPFPPQRTYVTTKRRSRPGDLIPVHAIPAKTTAVRRLGTLTNKKDYPIVGTYVDPTVNCPEDDTACAAESCWWKIDLGPGYSQEVTGPTRMYGWVRSDEVQECGRTDTIASAWPPAPRIRTIRQEDTGIRLSWDSPDVPVGAPAHLQISGYRVYRTNLANFWLKRRGITLPDLPVRNDWLDENVPAAEWPYYYSLQALAGDSASLSSRQESIAFEASRPVTPPPGQSPAPPLDRQSEVSVTHRLRRGSLSLNNRPGSQDEVPNGELRAGDFEPAQAILAPSGFDRSNVHLRVHIASTATALGGGAIQGQADTAQASEVVGWARQADLEGTGNWETRIQGLPQPPFARVRGASSVPVRIGPSLGYTEYVTEISRTDGWYEIIGQNDDWWQLQIDADTKGWVQDSQVEETGDMTDVPVVNESPPPALPGPGGADAPSTAAVTASGHYLNLANSWQGAWAVAKTGTTVTAAFQSTRSPVQYLARQNPQDLLVLPSGFRPLTDQDITVTGVHVTINGEDFDQSPPQTFTLRVSTTGAVRYVDGSALDHVGFLRYEIGTVASGVTLTWTTGTAATVSTRSSQSQQGNFTNRAVHVDGAWDLTRTGNTVRGTIRSSKSAVQYAARQNPQVLFTLPTAYRPTTAQDITVSGTRVDANGNDLPGSPTWGFTLRVAPNGQARYPDGPELNTVGYMRYDVAVRWRAAGTRLVPGVPRDLEARNLADTSLELEWEEPLDDGGADLTGYRLQVWNGANNEWDTVVSDTGDDDDDYIVTSLTPYTRYSYRVAARNAQGWGAFSPALTVTTLRTAPGQPDDLEAEATHDAVSLTWSAPTTGGTATGYRVARKQGRGDWHVVAADTGSAVTFFADGAVAVATGYTYRVRALNQGEEGAWSAAVTVTTAATPTIPGSPTGLTVKPGTASQLQLAWTAPTNTGGGVTGYRIERSPDVAPREWSDVVSDTGPDAVTWHETAVLTADTVYHYRVYARNSAGESAPSTSALGHTRPRLQLNQPVSYPLTAHAEPRPEANVTATFAVFLPERVLDLLAQVPDPNGWWRVQLFGTTASGPFWVPAGVGETEGDVSTLPQPPAAPGNFTATGDGSEVTLTWSAPATGAAVSGYRIWRQENNGNFAQLGTDLGVAALAHTDTTVQNNHAYHYWLQALSVQGPGVPSSLRALAVMTTPTAPATVRNLAVAATTTTLLLSWQRATTGGLPAGYRVAWRQSGTTDDFQTASVSGTSHQLADLRPGASYEIQITAFNQVGNATAATSTSSTQQTNPGTPVALAVVVQGNTATVTWQAPATEGTADSYEVQHKTRTAAWPGTSTSLTVLTQALTDLTFDGDYDLRVRTVNTVGNSDWVAVEFTAGPVRPGAVRDLTAAPGPDSQIQLIWQAPADHSAITGYRLERAVDADPLVWADVVADTGNTSVTWANRGLAADTVYHYRVTGRSSAGLGAVSAEVTTRTRPQLQLKTTATYPVEARAWPETTAPVTHIWDGHDSGQLDVVSQVTGTDGWWQILRFGESPSGPYWVPATAGTVTGDTTEVPQAPGKPRDLTNYNTITLTWTAPATGGAVTGYRLWRQIGDGDLVVIADHILAGGSYRDPVTTTGVAYTYKVQALGPAGDGPLADATTLWVPAGTPAT